MSIRFKWVDNEGNLLYEQFNPDGDCNSGESQLINNIIVLSDDKGNEKRFKVVPVED